MNGQDDERYEQIRSIAGKNWLKGASVSLARLDQVKTRVYNMGFADNQSLKIVPGKANIQSTRVEQAPAEPPLSRLTIQRNAWGSNTSIPELIRQQSERQRIRPESAKTRSTVRPHPSRRRPHSAKEPGKTSSQTTSRPPPHPAHAGYNMGVKGAHYEPGERLPEGIVSLNTATTGWSAPSNGLTNYRTPTDADEEAELKSLSYVNFPPEPPPPPHGSPDLSLMLDSHSQMAEYGSLNGSLGMAVDSLIEGCDSVPKRSPTLLRRPTPEPITLSLPQADYDDIEDDFDTERLLGREPQKLQYQHSNGAYKPDMPIESVFTKSNHNGDGDNLHAASQVKETAMTSETLPTECNPNDQVVDTMDSIFTNYQPGMKPRPKKANVVFAEERNITVDITPRDQPDHLEELKEHEGSGPESEGHEGPSRVYSGRRSLRHVKSKTDSGVQLTSTRSSGQAGLHKSTHSYTPPRNFVSRRPKSSKGRVPTISVQFADEDDDTKETAQDKRQSKKRKPPKGRDIETMMSFLSFEGTPSDNIPVPDIGNELGEDSDNDSSPDNHSGSPTKVTSGKQKNYYEVSLTMESLKGPDPVETPKNKQLTKTVKTISLAEDRSVEETKSVLTVDGYEHHTYGYVPPQHARPVSAKGRPTTSTTNKNKIKEPEHLELAEESELLERPESRMSSIHQRPSTGLLKKRPASSPSVRKSLRVVEKRYFKTRPMSAAKDHRSVCRLLHSHSASSMQDNKPSMAEAKRANAAAQAMRQNSNKTIAALGRPFIQAGGSKNKKIMEPPQDVIEIWTRKDDGLEMETEGLKECRELQERLLESGIPVTLDSLKRALLPPTEYGFYGSSYSSNTLPGQSSGLLTHPSTWMPDEYKRIEQTKKAVQLANAQLRVQAREEKRQLSAGSSSSSSLKTKTKKTKTRPKSSKVRS